MVSPDALKAAEQGALLILAPHLGTIAVSGPDRVSWLNGLVTSDLTKLSPGTASYGLVLIKIGRILADVWAVPAGDRLLLGVPRERVGALREHLPEYLMMEGASHVDASDEFGWALVHGPRAAALLSEVPPLHGGFGGVFDVTGLRGGTVAAHSHRLPA